MRWKKPLWVLNLLLSQVSSASELQNMFSTHLILKSGGRTFIKCFKLNSFLL